MAIHYLHSFDGGTASLAEARGRLDEIRTAVIHNFAGEFDFRGIQQPGLNDHFTDPVNAGRLDAARDFLQFRFNFRNFATFEKTNIHDNVDFVGSVTKRFFCFR
jgi:hypothetical protein